MKNVEKASQAMDERVNQREHRRLKEIWDVAMHSTVYLQSSCRMQLIIAFSEGSGGRSKDLGCRSPQSSVRHT